MLFMNIKYLPLLALKVALRSLYWILLCVLVAVVVGVLITFSGDPETKLVLKMTKIHLL